MKSLLVFLFAGSFLLMGCQNMLMTRSDVKEAEQRRQYQDQVSTLQKNNADVGGRFSEIEDDLRRMVGRVEVLETRLAQSNAEKEKISRESDVNSAESAKRIQILQEEIARLDGQLAAITESQKAQAAAPAATTSSGTKKNDFEQGEDLFGAKEWRRAILAYQKYRDANPKGKNFTEATYKMGVSFQELGLKDEARTFYEEVVAKHSKSPEAKKAKTRLNSLKK